jgi:Glyoxalase-like domain
VRGVRAAATLGMVCLMGAAGAQEKAPAEAFRRVDHLVYAVPDLARGIEAVEKLLEVRATPGGQHPGAGTRNALVALGLSSYLEIIGPDPEQPAPKDPRRFGIDTLAAPRLVAWAARESDLERFAADAAARGVKLGPVGSGSRKRPDGVLLSWRFTSPSAVLAGGIVPFFIDWGSSPHPSQTAAPGATLVALRAEHPDPPSAVSLLKALGLTMPVAKAATPALIAEIDCPKGRVILR